MARRVVPTLLVIWLVVGLVLMLGGSDEDPADGDLGMAEPAESMDAEERALASQAPATPLRAPGLESSGSKESASALLARLGRASTAAERAEISAWIRAHPERIGELMAALVHSKVRMPNRGWADFFKAVLGPLHDLEPRLSPGLITSLLALEPYRQYAFPPAIGALQALAPLSAPTRRSLEAWVRTNADRSWAGALTSLVIESASSGEELLPFLQWLLTPPQEGQRRVYIRGVMRSIAAMGERGRALGPEIAQYILSRQLVDVATAKALVAIGAEDPAARRALVALLGSRSPAFGAAYTFFEKRGDTREIVMAALEDPSPRVRFAAVFYVRSKQWREPADLLPALLSCLTSSDEVWRDKAMRTIPSMATGAADVVPTLEEMFRSQEEHQWVTAARMLQFLAGASYRKKFDVSGALGAALRHGNVRVRRLVVQGLRTYAPDTAVPMLRDALLDGDSAVRESALEGLGTLAQVDPAALALLKEATGHADPKVVETAKAWLEEVEDLTGKAPTESKHGK